MVSTTTRAKKILVVFEFNKPQLDPDDDRAKPLIKQRKGDLTVNEGYISLQSESHPCEFRKIELMELDPEE